MPKPRPKIPFCRRYEVADLARRGHGMAEGNPDPDDNPREWLREYQRLASAVEASDDERLIQRFDVARDVIDEEKDPQGIARAVAGLNHDPADLTPVQRTCI